MPGAHVNVLKSLHKVEFALDVPFKYLLNVSQVTSLASGCVLIQLDDLRLSSFKSCWNQDHSIFVTWTFPVLSTTQSSHINPFTYTLIHLFYSLHLFYHNYFYSGSNLPILEDQTTLLQVSVRPALPPDPDVFSFWHIAVLIGMSVVPVLEESFAQIMTYLMINRK